VTPERSRKISRRWLVMAISLIAVEVPLGMLGFDMFRLPLNAIALVCFYAAGDYSGWADGWKAANASKPGESKVSSCENTVTPTRE